MFDFDSAMFLWFNASAAPPAWLLGLARIASLDLPQWILAGTAGALLAGDAAVRRTVLRLFLAMAVAWCTARVVQHFVPMHRPFALGLGTVWVPHGDSPGFPSTHASVVFAFASVLIASTQHTLVRAGALALACLIAWSRVYLGLHFPLDVLVGAVVGLLSGWVGAWIPSAMPRVLAAHE